MIMAFSRRRCRLLYSLAELICLRRRFAQSPAAQPARMIAESDQWPCTASTPTIIPIRRPIIEKTGEVLKHTTHAFYDRLTKWQPSQAIEAMDKDGIAVSVLSIVDAERRGSATPPPRGRSRASVNDGCGQDAARLQGPLRPFRDAAAAGRRRQPARDRIRLRHAARPTASR